MRDEASPRCTNTSSTQTSLDIENIYESQRNAEFPRKLGKRAPRDLLILACSMIEENVKDTASALPGSRDRRLGNIPLEGGGWLVVHDISSMVASPRDENIWISRAIAP